MAKDFSTRADCSESPHLYLLEALYKKHSSRSSNRIRGSFVGARGHRLALAGYEEIEREQSPPFFLAGSTKHFYLCIRLANTFQSALQHGHNLVHYQRDRQAATFRSLINCNARVLQGRSNSVGNLRQGFFKEELFHG